MCAVQGKTLFNGEGDEGLGLGLGCLSLAAMRWSNAAKFRATARLNG